VGNPAETEHKMKVRYEEKEIDTENTRSFKMNGCNVRLFFTVEPNTTLNGMVLDNLIQVIERKRRATDDVQSPKSHLRHA